MSRVYLYAFEILMLGLLYFCLDHAFRKRSWVGIWQLMAGVFFGLILEYGTIQQLSAYEYGDFFLKIGPLPISIGIGWGVIIYSARMISDASNLPLWARPVLDALLALNIDLAMDAIAIRLGMWNWGRGLSFEYFGVPYANFWAWFWVVFSFSLSLRVLERLPGWAGDWMAPIGAILLGMIGVLSTNALIAYVLLPAGWYGISIAAVLLGALSLILILQPQLINHEINTIAFGVPFTFHIYFLVAGLLSGVIFTPVYLLAISFLMMAISVYIHRKIWLGLIRRKSLA
jgi:hypothetical protein